MIQCRYCGRSCSCHYTDPCVCTDICYDCDVKPDEEPMDELFDVFDGFLDDYDDGGES